MLKANPQETVVACAAAKDGARVTAAKQKADFEFLRASRWLGERAAVLRCSTTLPAPPSPAGCVDPHMCSLSSFPRRPAAAGLSPGVARPLRVLGSTASAMATLVAQW